MESKKHCLSKRKLDHMKKTNLVVFLLAFLFIQTNNFAQGNKNLFAGIEIGSKGIKMTVLDINNIKKGDFTIKTYWSENVGIAKNISIDSTLAK